MSAAFTFPMPQRLEKDEVTATTSYAKFTAAASNAGVAMSDQKKIFESVSRASVAFGLTADDTKVVLHHFGPDYYFDKIWVQGKNYGYEFPLPDAVKARMREQMAPVTLAATYVAEEEVAEAPPPPPVEEPPAEPEIAQVVPPAPELAPAEPEPLPAMPVASSGWLMMLLAGGALSGAGLALRRRA